MIPPRSSELAIITIIETEITVNSLLACTLHLPYHYHLVLAVVNKYFSFDFYFV
jgi:hypothetical protein